MSLIRKNHVQQKNKLNAVFTELLQLTDISEQEITKEQRSKAWSSLQKLRLKLQESELKGREFELLQNAYKTITNSQLNWWQQGLFPVKTWLISVIDSLDYALHYPLISFGESLITLQDIVWVLAVMIGAHFLSNYIQKSIEKLGKTKRNISEASLFTISRIVHYIIILIAILIAFSTLGIDFSKLALVAGALSVGIGFGLQSIFNNFISGLILLFERSLKVGDLIKLESGIRGRIKSINVRSTQVTTWDNIDILVPNSEFISGRVTNYMFSDDLRRLHIPFGVAYGTDKELVRQAVIEAAMRVPHTIIEKETQAPDVWLVNYGESSLDFELVIWIKGNKLPKHKNPKAIYLWEIETSLNEYGIEIPFPQRDLHIKGMSNDVMQEIKMKSKKD